MINLQYLAAALKRRETVSIEIDARQLTAIVKKLTPRPTLLEMLQAQGLTPEQIYAEVQ